MSESRTCYFDTFAKKNIAPGPGSHNPSYSPVFKRVRTAFCDTKEFRSKIPVTLGPVSYKIQSQERKQSFSIGKEKRPDHFTDVKKSLIPGPIYN